MAGRVSSSSAVQRGAIVVPRLDAGVLATPSTGPGALLLGDARSIAHGNEPPRADHRAIHSEVQLAPSGRGHRHHSEHLAHGTHSDAADADGGMMRA